MKEFDGLKRSYYMDPQPLNGFEWHLYEYEITNCDACALYRLEFKIVDGKKSPKGKVTNDPLADLQKQMGRSSAEVPAVQIINDLLRVGQRATQRMQMQMFTRLQI